jgi:hypothetical protein
MYIVIGIADASPVLGPMSHFITSIQHIRHKATSIPLRGTTTYRYAGGIAQIMLKKMMTRHESRRPSPKVTGPRVPEANL